ncbi:uncharacterized protein LOC119582554 [Penaeus monodon]|uniref:uncharacterized protein LOC119582554 n=1 Tax=Penaeus monodon TaxID=6687 RepID=UPI0018A7D525|nr:uncharacterized protein LOC119582554 [Penaeus monodon]
MTDLIVLATTSRPDIGTQWLPGSIRRTMPDDAPQPRPDFYTPLPRSFAKFTRFIDEHIRIIQYCVYGVGAVGIAITLHSVRAFSKFRTISDIPKEFISKHIRLHGHVRWVGVSPPRTATSPPILALPATHTSKSSESASDTQPSSSLESGSISSPLSVTKEEDKENGKQLKGGDSRSLSSDNRGIYDGAGELHPWDDGIDPDVDRIFYEEELRPVYLQIEHSPAIPVFRKSDDTCLPLHLADVEVSRAGLQRAKEQLMGKRAWFTLISHDADANALVSIVKPVKFLRRRSLNEQLVRNGEALTGPMNLDLFDDKAYTKFYRRLAQAQDYAERKKIGLWKPPPDPPGAISLLKRVWRKIKVFVGRTG